MKGERTTSTASHARHAAKRVGEALTAEPEGQPLSHVTKSVREADAFCVAEGNTMRCANASAWSVPRGLRPWHAGDTSYTGTGRSHRWPPRKKWSASGRPEAVADDARR